MPRVATQKGCALPLAVAPKQVLRRAFAAAGTSAVNLGYHLCKTLSAASSRSMLVIAAMIATRSEGPHSSVFTLRPI